MNRETRVTSADGVTSAKARSSQGHHLKSSKKSQVQFGDTLNAETHGRKRPTSMSIPKFIALATKAVVNMGYATVIPVDRCHASLGAVGKSLVSLISPKANVNLPGAYTKVEPYLDWIKARVPIGEGPGPIPTSRPNPTQGPKPGNDYTCSASGDVVAVKADCARYVVCTSSSSGIKMSCSPGLLFNPRAKTCDWPANVKSLRDDCN